MGHSSFKARAPSARSSPMRVMSMAIWCTRYGLRSPLTTYGDKLVLGGDDERRASLGGQADNLSRRDISTSQHCQFGNTQIGSISGVCLTSALAFRTSAQVRRRKFGGHIALSTLSRRRRRCQPATSAVSRGRTARHHSAALA